MYGLPATREGLAFRVSARICDASTPSMPIEAISVARYCSGCPAGQHGCSEGYLSPIRQCFYLTIYNPF